MQLKTNGMMGKSIKATARWHCYKKVSKYRKGFVIQLIRLFFLYRFRVVFIALRRRRKGKEINVFKRIQTRI